MFGLSVTHPARRSAVDPLFPERPFRAMEKRAWLRAAKPLTEQAIRSQARIGPTNAAVSGQAWLRLLQESLCDADKELSHLWGENMGMLEVVQD
jgi:hypothetical protein